MPIAFVFLSLLVALFPILAIRDELVTQSIPAALAAVSMATTGVAARAADVQFAAHVTRRLGFAAAIPAIWMIIQILPMPFPELSHTVWTNGKEALGQEAWGHITIDLGKTIQALAFYFANIAIILATILVARNHQRASRLFTLLGAITILTVVVLLASRFIPAGATADQQDVLGAASMIGLMLSLAAGAAGLDQKHSTPEGGRRLLFASGVGILISAAGLVATANTNIAIVAAFGVATFASIQLVRRLRLVGWTTAILLATLIAAATMIILWRFDANRALSPLLQFATAPTNSLAVAQRLLSETGWFGIGAGTYAALLPIYREFGDAATQPPSAAAALAVELGLPMALVSLAIGLGLIVVLYRGALARGRDSFYAAAAASGAVVLIGGTFCDASLLHVGVAAIGDVLIGIGLAQSVSRAE